MGKVEEVINKVKEAGENVWDDLKGGWPESIYQKAMEVALREREIIFETQRILPVFYRDREGGRDYCVGEGIPDLIVWVESGQKRVAIVVDLKADQNIKEDHCRQVQKYIEAMEKQLKENESVHPDALVINFSKGSGRKIPDEFIEKEGPEIITVNRNENIAEKIESSRKRGKKGEEKTEEE